MIPDAEYAYEALLRFNYFPMVKEHRDEVPPIFTTEDLTPAVADEMISAGTSRAKAVGFDQIEYRVTRFNSVIRKLNIPHPLPYATLCQAIRDNWDQLKHICANQISRIRPESHGERLIVMGDYGAEEVVEGIGRLVIMERTKFPSDLLRHLNLTTGAKYWVEADIGNCFPSIYSHAIPWALVGHDAAKKNRDPSEWYNRLDQKQRFLNRGETQGAPIGPATSNVLCEIILHKVDLSLSDLGYRFVRFIDDYNCFTKSQDDAENVSAILDANSTSFCLG